MPRILGVNEPAPDLIVTYERADLLEKQDPLVYVKTGATSFVKVKLSEAAAFCEKHDIAPEWETREERNARRAREHAARPKPEPGTREAFAQIPHRDV